MPALSGSRERLLDATLRVLAEKGYDDLNVRDVAALAGVGTSSIYHFFGGKDGLCRAALHHFDDRVRLEQHALGDEGDDPLRRLEALADWVQRSGDYEWRRYYDTAMARAGAQLDITPSAAPEARFVFQDQVRDTVLAAVHRGDLIPPDGYHRDELATMIAEGIMGIVGRTIVGDPAAVAPLDRTVPLFLTAVITAFGRPGV